MKKVLLVIIDALASRVVIPAMEAGRLPCLAQLAEHGTVRRECVSIFPSITPAATASIATGVYPSDHHIAGAFWYDPEEDCVAYYGDDLWVVINEGMDKFFNDFLVRLNRDRLHVDTLFERVERNGRTAAAINSMWFRGQTQHEVSAPLLLKLFPGVSFAPSVSGPKVLALADFAASLIPGRDARLSARGGLTRRYGFHDDTTAEFLHDLASAEPFPDFTLAYFPNNDFESHQEGPASAERTLQRVDAQLASFIEQMGGLRALLSDCAVLILGDHAQSDLAHDEKERKVDLTALLEGYQLVQAGKPWQHSDDLMVCPNMRACHVYLRSRSSQARDQVVQRLLQDPRIDQVCWRESTWDRDETDPHIEPRDDEFHVASSDRGQLAFRYSQHDATADGHDGYGNGWSLKGDLACVDARLERGRVLYDLYPNALERIAGGFSHLAGHLWLTAREGCEFAMDETSVHAAGSHGALNRDDSITTLIAAGVPRSVATPRLPRTIDVAPLALRILGLADEADALTRMRNAAPPS